MNIVPSTSGGRVVAGGTIVAVLAWFFPAPIEHAGRLLAQMYGPEQRPVIQVTVTMPAVTVARESVTSLPQPEPKRRVETFHAQASPAIDPWTTAIDTSLPAPSGDWPWAVIVYGEGGARATDLGSAAVQTIGNQGGRTVSLFRDSSSEERFAPELFRGSHSVAARLRLARYCTRLLIGRVTATSLGSLNGLIVARATVSFHLLSADGSIIKQVDVTEKGGGLTDEAAIANAIEELRGSLSQRLTGILP
jgi:hypothetical protein